MIALLVFHVIHEIKEHLVYIPIEDRVLGATSFNVETLGHFLFQSTLPCGERLKTSGSPIRFHGSIPDFDADDFICDIGGVDTFIHKRK